MFAIVDDLFATAIADHVENRRLRFACRAAIVGFVTAFVGAFAARGKFERVALATVLMYWITIVFFRYFLERPYPDPGIVKFVLAGLTTILSSIAAAWLGAIAGGRFYSGGIQAHTRFSCAKRRWVLVFVSPILFALFPYSYLTYWKAEAVDAVQIALDALQAGEVPDKVYPFDGPLVDHTSDVDALVNALSAQTKLLPDYKMGEYHHLYVVEIWTDDVTRYTAFAGYDYGEWHISCCWRE